MRCAERFRKFQFLRIDINRRYASRAQFPRAL
ncbi:hypothetical protein SEEN6907_14314 [Salmonella enterica subsp. enterica serovar Newport str. VA_R100506907]|nr:hypothetical protein SEEN6907_14314 [Salmonella enterica subsp. enterica serovar Newport str. VA_R100506907]